MGSRETFLCAIALWNAVNALLAWCLPRAFIALNGFDYGGSKMLAACGVTLFVLAATYAAPVLSGVPGASRRVCRLSAFAYGTGVPIGWMGGTNYIMMGQSAVASAGCAFFGFVSTSSPREHLEEEENRGHQVQRNASIGAQICVGLLALSILADGMQALFAPENFLSMNDLGTGGVKLLQGIGLVHVLASIGAVGSGLSGTVALRTYCKIAACAFATGILGGVLSHSMTMIGEALAVSSVLAYFGFVVPSEVVQRDDSEGPFLAQERDALIR